MKRMPKVVKTNKITTLPLTRQRTPLKFSEHVPDLVAFMNTEQTIS